MRRVVWKLYIGYIVYLVGGIRTEGKGVVNGHGHPMALSVEPYLGVESIGGESGYVITLIGTPSYGLYVGIE